MLAPDDTTRGWPAELLKRIRYSYEFDRAVLSTIQTAIAATVPPSYGAKAASTLSSIAARVTRGGEKRPMSLAEVQERLGRPEVTQAMQEIDELCPPWRRIPIPRPHWPQWWHELQGPSPDPWHLGPQPEPWHQELHGPHPDPWRAEYADVVSVRAIAIVAALPALAGALVDEQAQRDVRQIVTELQDQIA